MDDGARLAWDRMARDYRAGRISLQAIVVAWGEQLPDDATLRRDLGVLNVEIDTARLFPKGEPIVANPDAWGKQAWHQTKRAAPTGRADAR